MSTVGRVGFWRSIKKPFYVMAPLANVTDCAFRRVIAKHGRPDVMWTEFVSVDGLHHSRDRLLIDLKFDPQIERPILAQIFGKDPALFYECTQLVKSLGFDGVDINMGCPDKSVCNHGGGSYLINDPKLAQKIISECKRAAGDDFPVSVKTRIGYHKIDIEGWIPYILDMEPAALTLHLRTKKEMSMVPAHWDHEILDKVTTMIRDRGNKTLLIGNGDVVDRDDGRRKIDEFGIDGVMIGRGTFGKPWLFSGKPPPSLQDQIRILIEHTDAWEEMLSGYKNFLDMRKHYKAYVGGFHGAKEFRRRLLTTESAKEAREIAHELIRYIDAGKHLIDAIGGESL